MRRHGTGWFVRAAVVLALLIAAGCTASGHPGHPSAAGGPGHPSSSGPDTSGPGHQRPNIVFVLTDDLSTDLVQYMPHVLALERAGTSLQNYFVVDSLCCPSRSAIFTGQYPHDNGVFTNHGPDGGYDAYNAHHDPAKSFAVALQKAGYRTGLMGKYLNGYDPQDPSARGWDEWDVAGDGYPEFNYRLNENGDVWIHGSRPADYLTDVLSNRAGSFIEDAIGSHTPFALEVATFAPHRPWVPAPRDQGSFPQVRAPRGPAFDRAPTDAPSWLAGFPPLSTTDVHRIDRAYRRRVESVQAVDRMIGHLEQVLAARGELGNTYFVFSSDNGFHMGQHRLMPGKQTAFDTDIRVPLVVTGPGVPAGARVDTMTSSVDLASTFTDIAGTTMRDAPDGSSLLPLWHGAPAPAGWPASVLVEHRTDPKDAGDPDRQPFRAGDPPSYEAIRTAQALYVEYADGAREYYDLATDPAELHNVVHDLPPERIAALHRTLRAMVACHGAEMCQRAAANP